MSLTPSRRNKAKRIRKRPKRRREKLGLGPEALLLQGHERTGKIVRMLKERNSFTSSVLRFFSDERQVRENGIIPHWGTKKTYRNVKKGSLSAQWMLFEQIVCLREQKTEKCITLYSKEVEKLLLRKQARWLRQESLRLQLRLISNL